MKLQITETITHEVDIDIDKLKKLFEVKGWSGDEINKYMIQYLKGSQWFTIVSNEAVDIDVERRNEIAIARFMEYESLSYSQFIKELNGEDDADNICECGGRLALVIGEFYYEPDSEPFTSGIVEDSNIEASAVPMNGYVCEKCKKVSESWEE